jgi:putative tryptophan/tyrosine transport system substrate-binding protein
MSPGSGGYVKRRNFIALLGGAAASSAWSMTSSAQQPPLPIIGFLSSLSAAALAGPVAAFLEGLGSVGYVEGKNVTVEFRWAEGHYDLLPDLAAGLVKERAAVIVAVGGDPPAFAAKAASTTIPLVFMVGQDPVKLGLVASLNRPGGNATGINLLVTETESKRVEILQQLAPGGSRFAAFVNPKNADADVQSSAVQAAAQAIGQQIEVINASTDLDLENAFVHLTQSNINGLLLLADPFFVYRRQKIIAEAAQRRIPAVYFLREFAESGGLASYGTSLADAYRQAGIYAGKILGGTKPADLPVVQATKFELVINLKTAKALGLAVPDKLLALAEQVIE